LGRGWRHFVLGGSRHYGAGATVRPPYAASPSSGYVPMCLMAGSHEFEHGVGPDLSHFSPLCFTQGAIPSSNLYMG
jgi:hypothetical protein